MAEDTLTHIATIIPGRAATLALAELHQRTKAGADVSAYQVVSRDTIVIRPTIQADCAGSPFRLFGCNPRERENRFNQDTVQAASDAFR